MINTKVYIQSFKNQYYMKHLGKYYKPVGNTPIVIVKTRIAVTEAFKQSMYWEAVLQQRKWKLLGRECREGSNGGYGQVGIGNKK